mmetsp:Transcript_87786/g.231293  ORF Transcript_87786/g.231293 Transcript_87786/m.231293 type:complete len:200 (-) Transcript_87786:1406-2005(-)
MEITASAGPVGSSFSSRSESGRPARRRLRPLPQETWRRLCGGAWCRASSREASPGEGRLLRSPWPLADCFLGPRRRAASAPRARPCRPSPRSGILSSGATSQRSRLPTLSSSRACSPRRMCSSRTTLREGAWRRSTSIGWAPSAGGRASCCGRAPPSSSRRSWRIATSGRWRSAHRAATQALSEALCRCSTRSSSRRTR